MGSPVFFVRRFNDIDHVAPVIFGYCREGRAATVLCLNPYLDIRRDFRLRFLAQAFPHLRVDYAYNRGLRTSGQRLLSALYCQQWLRDSPTTGPPPAAAWISRLTKAARDRMRRLLESSGAIRRTYDKVWAERLCHDLDASALVFDHIKLHQYVARPLFEAAHALGIKTIGLPHGLPLRSSQAESAVYLATGFDHVVEPHRWAAASHADHRFPADRTHILGSARFCDEWRSELARILPVACSLPESSSGNLRVLYLERGADLHGDRGPLVRDTLVRIAGMPGVTLVIKAHTRSNRIHFDLPAEVTVDTESNSVRAIEWADVVIATVSSVVVEALCQGKPVIQPQFFHGENLLISQLGACWTVEDPSELEHALRVIQWKPDDALAHGEGAARFLLEAVYAGEPGRAVLAGYSRLIRCAERQSTTSGAATGSSK